MIAISSPEKIDIVTDGMGPAVQSRVKVAFFNNATFWDGVSGGVRSVLAKNPNFKHDQFHYYFAFDLQEEFQVRFQTEPEVAVEALTIQYVHIFLPGMDPPLYWVKTLNGKHPDPDTTYP
ncbi:hypothetical protein [Alkalihalobacillus sp. AL-G]|uniref:hypothetical protein n=1 Tax=Alkalihalobacillus sp. AL-G TaxID=2926399 RepID=UPI00272A419A|nr:hypothetical protein [Alkalihalobacillus sp. AL-G]WLD94216.1 hypothetical protein MOJ78_04805 [Alkalihalobacillus sp. AL-G]